MYWGVLQSEEISLLWKTKFILFHHRQFCRKKKRKCKVPCSSFKVLNRAAWWGNGMYYSWLLEIIVLASHFFIFTEKKLDICCILYQINMFLHLKDNICKPERLCSTTILHKMLFWHTLSTLSHKLQLLWFRYCNFNNILINCAALV